MYTDGYRPTVPVYVDRVSSVGIVTRYGLESPGIESRWGGKNFRTCPDQPWGPRSLLYNRYRVFPGGKATGRGAGHSHPLIAPKLKKKYSYISWWPAIA